MKNELETRASNSAPTLEADGKFFVGRAAVFYDPQNPGTEYVFEVKRDQGRPPMVIHERILRGAFDLALAQDDVRCLYNHRDLLGRRVPGRTGNTLDLSVDAVGLNYRCGIPGHSIGQMVKESIERSDLDGSSFGFRIREGGVTYRQEGDILIRELTSLELADVSPVDVPAYRATQAGIRCEIRSEDELRTLDSLLAPPPPAYDGRDQDRLRLLQLRMQSLETLPAETRSDAASFGSIEQQLYRLLTAATGRDWLWPTEVFETFCTYELGNPPALYQQAYTVDSNGLVSLSGLPVKVARKTTFEAI